MQCVIEIISGRCRFGNECLKLHEGPSKVSGATKKKRTVKVEKSPERSPDRGWVIFIWTGLNIKIGIAQKVNELWNCSFAKMIVPSGENFGKRTVS